MSKLKSKGNSKAESVAPAAADSAVSHQEPVVLTPAEQQALDAFFDLVARLIARAHVRGTFAPAADQEAQKSTDQRNGKESADGPQHRCRSRTRDR